jgi:hypothetical protein
VVAAAPALSGRGELPSDQVSDWLKAA